MRDQCTINCLRSLQKKVWGGENRKSRAVFHFKNKKTLPAKEKGETNGGRHRVRLGVSEEKKEYQGS